jgi:hypothetical protein
MRVFTCKSLQLRIVRRVSQLSTRVFEQHGNTPRLQGEFGARLLMFFHDALRLVLKITG